MAELKEPRRHTHNEDVADRALDFWTRYNKPIIIISSAIILLAGAFLAYKYLIQGPKEEKAQEAMFKAEDYFRKDSLQQALKGDGLNAGFVKIISQYGNTKAGNLARFYAGAASLKTGDFATAAKYLKEFDTDSKPTQARTYKLLGDAYAEQGKNNDALDNYKKAAHEFETDETNSSDYLFTAAYFAQKVVKDQKQAIDLFKELKTKYPKTQRGFEADKYLASLGVYN